MDKSRYVPIIMVMLYLITFDLISVDFQIEKVNEFSIANRRIGTNRVNNIIIEYPYLYTLTRYGLEVYSMEVDGSLTLLTRKLIIEPWTMEKIGNHLFIGTSSRQYDPFNAMIHKIDVTNPSEPFVVQSLEFDDNVPWVPYLNVLNDHFIVNTVAWPPFNPLINTALEIIHPNPIPTYPHLLFSDTLILSRVDHFDHLIYDISDIDNVSVVGSGNISEAHNYGIYHQGSYEDSTLIFNNTREISFWDVTDLNDWQLLYNIPWLENEMIIFGDTFYIMNNYLLYLNPFNLVAIDMNDYTIQQISEDDFFFCEGIDAADWEDNVYFTVLREGIQRFRYEDSEFHYIDTTSDHRMNAYIYLNDNHVFVRSDKVTSGFRVHDISNPLNIIEITRIFEGVPKLAVSLRDYLVNNLLILRDCSNYEFGDIEVYDVSDPFNPHLRNSIDISFWSGQNVLVNRYESDPDALYIKPWYQNILRKYDISEEGQYELLFEMDLSYLENDVYYVIDNDYMYCLTRRGNLNWHRLSIFSGMNDNAPLLQNTIDYFVFHPDPLIKMTGDYLTIYDPSSSGYSNTDFYSLSDPVNPELVFQIPMPGVPYIKDDLLYQSPGSAIFVFDLSNEPNGIIAPFTYFLHNVRSNWIFFRESNDLKYLFACSYATSIGVFEYSHDLSVGDDLVVVPKSPRLLQNYPNPFNPETTIKFILEREGVVLLEIYNIKGQRITELINEKLPQGEHSIVWNPLTAKGKDLPSGVYLYRLRTDGYERTRKMLFLK
ncbi:MAG: T9SS type A sorting domain-containing protein [Candidatus Cloacimonetes bacterium]|nr:T9SS type A sorting domain-containing protein [Candidatus Cloacimonadota bacterium]